MRCTVERGALVISVHVNGLGGLFTTVQRGKETGSCSKILGAAIKINTLIHGAIDEFIIERSIPDPSVVRDASSALRPLSARSLRLRRTGRPHRHRSEHRLPRR